MAKTHETKKKVVIPKQKEVGIPIEKGVGNDRDTRPKKLQDCRLQEV